MLIVARGCFKQYLLPAHPLFSFPRPWRELSNRAPDVPAAWTDGSIPSHQCRPLSPPGCLRIRLRIPPVLALFEEYRGLLPITRHAEHARRDLECRRCITSHAASQSHRSAGETPSDRSLQGEIRRSDRMATTLRSSRTDLAVFRGCHALGTSMRLWGCAGRSYPSHSTSSSPATWWERARCMARACRAHPASVQAGTGRISAWACAVRRKLSPNPAYSDGKRSSRCSHVTLSTRQPLPACSR